MFPAPRTRVLVEDPVVVMDMDMVCRPDLKRNSGTLPTVFACPKSNVRPIPSIPSAHPHELAHVAAKELFVANHVLQAGKHPVLDRTLPHPSQGLLLEVPDLPGQELSCRGKVARVDRDPVQ